MFNWSGALTYFVLCWNLKIHKSSSLTVGDVLVDCEEDQLHRKVCLGFGHLDDRTYYVGDCSPPECFLWLRAEISKVTIGEWERTIELTAAVVHRQLGLEDTWHAFIVLERSNGEEPLVISVSRRFSGTVRYSYSDNQLASIYNFSMSKKDIWGDERTLVFRISIPSSVQIQGQWRPTLSAFTKLKISTGPERNFNDNPFIVSLTDQQKFSLQHHSGYQYAGCGEANMACFSVPRDLNEEQCLEKGNCNSFVRIKAATYNQTLFYLSRRLPGAATGYISAGFSNNSAMGTATVFDCIKEENSTQATNSYNEGHQNFAYLVPFFSLHRMSEAGYVECLWRIENYMGFSMHFETSSYHVVRAIGRIGTGINAAGAREKMKHTLTAVTPYKIRISATIIIEENMPTVQSNITILTTTVSNGHPEIFSFWLLSLPLSYKLV